MRRSRVVQCKRRWAPKHWTWRGSKITESSCASRNFSAGRWILKRDQKRSSASNDLPRKPEEDRTSTRHWTETVFAEMRSNQPAMKRHFLEPGFGLFSQNSHRRVRRYQGLVEMKMANVKDLDGRVDPIIGVMLLENPYRAKSINCLYIASPARRNVCCGHCLHQSRKAA
jgi:hypothetical protein